MKRPQEIDGVAEPAGKGITTIEGIPAEEEIESTFGIQMIRFPVAVGHGQLIEIGQQTGRLAVESKFDVCRTHAAILAPIGPVSSTSWREI